jgi:hypothetical protein
MMYETAPTGSLSNRSPTVSDQTAGDADDCALLLPPGFDAESIYAMTDLETPSVSQERGNDLEALDSDGSLGLHVKPNQTGHDFSSSCMGMPHGDRVYLEYRENSASSLKDDEAYGKGTTLDPESRIDLASFSGTMNTVFSDFQATGSPGLRFWNKPGLYECLAQHREPEGNGILWLIMKTQNAQHEVREPPQRRPRRIRCQTVTYKRFLLTVAQITGVSDGTTAGTAFERTELESFIVDVQVPPRMFGPGRKDLEAERRQFEKNFDSSLRANLALKRFFQVREIDVREQGRLIEALIACPATVLPHIA